MGSPTCPLRNLHPVRSFTSGCAGSPTSVGPEPVCPSRLPPPTVGFGAHTSVRPYRIVWFPLGMNRFSATPWIPPWKHSLRGKFYVSRETNPCKDGTMDSCQNLNPIWSFSSACASSPTSVGTDPYVLLGIPWYGSGHTGHTPVSPHRLVLGAKFRVVLQYQCVTVNINDPIGILTTFRHIRHKRFRCACGEASLFPSFHQEHVP